MIKSNTQRPLYKPQTCFDALMHYLHWAIHLKKQLKHRAQFLNSSLKYYRHAQKLTQRVSLLMITVFDE
jgi:hypothetical protein